MGRIYSVPFQGTVTAAGRDTDLFQLQPADDKPIKLRGFSLAQTSEVGDAAEEGARISVVRLGATISGADGTSVTPVPMDSADAAAGFTAAANDTTVATTSGSTTIVAEYGWNLRNSPYEVWYPDERFCPKAKQGEGLFIRLQTTLADDISFQGTAWVEEE